MNDLSQTPPPWWEGLLNLPPLFWERGIRGGEAKIEDLLVKF
jgi:hypothetical protein